MFLLMEMILEKTFPALHYQFILTTWLEMKIS